jgi:tRNA modification GTPase
MIALLTSLPGLRLAEPGEFTRRAFEAGKLDLAAVEGLADLIDSETEWQRRQALQQMDGALGRAAQGWRQSLIRAMSLLEADLDFSDEGDVDGPLRADAVAAAASVHAGIAAAIHGAAVGERIRDGFTVVITGPPNSGKSSLLNALAGREAAIVSAIPGTTRDAIEVRLDLHGLPVTLVDTAGLRETADPLEAEGVRRARSRAAHADLVLALRAIDSEAVWSAPPGAILVSTKRDLASGPVPGLAVSTRDGSGLPDLVEAIADRLRSGVGPTPVLVTRERQRLALEHGAEALARILAADARLPPELLAEDLRVAVRALDRLVGRVDVEDVLDALFAGFCIGK